MTLDQIKNDSNVYILGAGFSFDAGIPMIRPFMNAMRDAFVWCGDNGRPGDAEAIANVLKFRLRASSAAYRTPLDLENIEELFSLASSGYESVAEQDIRIAIAATIDYARAMKNTPRVEWNLDRSAAPAFSVPSDWDRVPEEQDEFAVQERVVESYRVPLYDYYIARMIGWDQVNKHWGDALEKNTFITFNYDMMVEESLDRLGVGYSYGLGQGSFRYEPRGWGARLSRATSSVNLLKLHGSLNWGVPGGTRGAKFTIFESEAKRRADEVAPVIVPPTWRKTFGSQLTQVWDQSVLALRGATRVFVIGFSIPVTDMHFKYLLAAGLQDNVSLRHIEFVDPYVENVEMRAKNVLREASCEGALRFTKATTSDFFFDERQWSRLHRPSPSFLTRVNLKPDALR